ncbi:MAG: SDR family NAD(P)-dependent oxidoreductase [Burkholderiaceae bacterium]
MHHTHHVTPLRTAIVTGGTRRIGRAVALGLARDGVQVVMLSRQRDADAEQTLADVMARGVDALHLTADVTDEAVVRQSFAAAAERFGSIDIVIHCAGLRSHAALADIPLAHWRAVMATNLDAAFLCSQAALPYFPATGGRIVFFSGAAASIGVAMRSHVSAAKAGIEGLTRALAAELADRHITVNCISPGIIDTSGTAEGVALTAAMQQLRILAGRQGRPEEIAAAVRLLVSGEGGYITGQVLRVNGGLVYG